MKAKLVISFLLWVLIATGDVKGEFVIEQVQQVPIGRVLQNLENRLHTNTSNVELLYHLARVHSMAYATNLTEVPVAKRSHLPYFGPPCSSDIPDEIYPPKTARAQTIALDHLTNAIRYYQRAVNTAVAGKSEESHSFILPSCLGHAWCLDQAGRKPEAITAYREALKRAWNEEVINRKSIGPCMSYSEEIINYLLRDLNPKTDGPEISDLKSKREKIQKMPRLITPILAPVSADVALNELVNSNAAVMFDLDGTGMARPWGWITPKAAWLVYDENARGHITSGLQMFGSITFWIFWRNGYDALSALDDNGDGVLTGGELRGLALWQDANGNGVSDPGEVKPVTDYGIAAIKCTAQPHPTGIPFNPEGLVFKDGKTRPTYDWMVPSAIGGESTNQPSLTQTRSLMPPTDNRQISTFRVF